MSTDKPNTQVLQGNEAAAIGALAGGLDFFAGYPITPSSEIAEIMSRTLPLVGGRFIQMEDEIASMAAIIGASLAGARTMTATSGPGFSLMQEHLGFACLAEVPCVVVNVQRAGPSTGLPTQPAQQDIMQTRWGTHGDHAIIALAPSSVRECFTMTVDCLNLAELYRTPVVLLMDEVIGHMRESVAFPRAGTFSLDMRQPPQKGLGDYCPFDECGEVIAPLSAYGGEYRFHVTGLTHDKRGFPTMVSEEVDHKIHHIVEKIEGHADRLARYEEYMVDDADVLLFAYGSTARVAKASVKSLREDGIKAGLLRVKTIWPFSRKRLDELAESLKLIVVPEMNLGQYVLEVERAMCGRVPVRHFGRVDGHLFVPDQISDFVRKEVAR
jgi:2-oxoglutarate ferredoxin oxidoreductase subunit alpha